MPHAPFPNETADYRKARNALLEQEIALRRQMEAIAEQRRKLPMGGKVPEDYVFDGVGADGRAAKIKLSELFRDGTDTLLVYNYMFPRYKTDERAAATSGEIAKLPKREQPCPSCTVLLDQLDSAAPQFESMGGNFVVVAKTSLDHLLSVARDRGWKHLRLLSSANNRFKRDYHAEDAEGQQDSIMHVFKRAPDGTIRFFWASELNAAPREEGQDPRALGTLDLFWNMLDLTPGGRPDRNEQLQYEECCSVSKAKALTET